MENTGGEEFPLSKGKSEVGTGAKFFFQRGKKGGMEMGENGVEWACQDYSVL